MRGVTVFVAGQCASPVQHEECDSGGCACASPVQHEECDSGGCACASPVQHEECDSGGCAVTLFRGRRGSGAE